MTRTTLACHPGEMFSKRLQDLTAADIQGVAESQMQEGGEVEFKETLPAKGGEDPWLKDQQQIGDRARNELLSEVIAFANAFGGIMILAMAETDEKPARAKAVVPLPKCIELADRLRLQCRDCIEPQIPMLEVVGVPMQQDGAGVVAFRAPSSRMAPHRHTVTRECYARRADRTEKMTMREIQDLTLHVERGIRAIDAEFERSKAQFNDRLHLRKNRDGFGIRVTGVPLVPLWIEKLQQDPSAHLPLVRTYGSIGQKTFDLLVPISHVQWRPTLRGIDGAGGSDDFTVELRGRANGLIDYWLIVAVSKGDVRGRAIYPGWVMGLVANALLGIERYRHLAGAAEIEYGLEMEVFTSEALPIGKYGGSHVGDWLGPFPSGQLLFPRYSVGNAEEFTRLATLIERDFWNAAGHAWNVDQSLVVDFKRARGDVGL